MEILSVDPGKMTGLAWWVNEEHGSAEVTYEETAPAVARFIREHPEAYIICENFFITMETAKKSQSTWSLRLIGAIEYICQEAGLNPPVMQQPSQAKNFGSDARLKVLGWYKGSTKGFAGHADDASRHLMLYMATHKLIDLGRIVDV